MCDILKDSFGIPIFHEHKKQFHLNEYTEHIIFYLPIQPDKEDWEIMKKNFIKNDKEKSKVRLYCIVECP